MQKEIDRILSGEVEITPSPGFVGAVMEAVEQEAAASRPLEFPWLRVMPAFVALVVALVAAIWNGIGLSNDPAATAAFNALLLPFLDVARGVGLHWILLAAAISFVASMAPLGLLATRSTAPP